MKQKVTSLVLVVPVVHLPPVPGATSRALPVHQAAAAAGVQALPVHNAAQLIYEESFKCCGSVSAHLTPSTTWGFTPHTQLNPLEIDKCIIIINLHSVPYS